MEIEPSSIIYRDGDFLLGKSGGKYYLCTGEQSFQLSSYHYEPCLYIKGADGFFLTIHHAFTLDELCRVAQSNGSMKMITGDEYDMQGICMLLRKALTLPMESVDIGYLEARCFADYLEKCGAVSEETAVPLADWGIKNPNVMNSLLHAKKVNRTNDARYYIVKSYENGGSDRVGKTDRFFRVISNQVRFGCGYRKIGSEVQYFAWHGYPDRNDDYITTGEITRGEFEEINRAYPKEISADRETAQIFREKYVDGHSVILEGWNKTL